jgi:hypothetical protein
MAVSGTQYKELRQICKHPVALGFREPNASLEAKDPFRPCSLRRLASSCILPGHSGEEIEKHQPVNLTAEALVPAGFGVVCAARLHG